jgi:hypothetical protein
MTIDVNQLLEELIEVKSACSLATKQVIITINKLTEAVRQQNAEAKLAEDAERAKKVAENITKEKDEK